MMVGNRLSCSIHHKKPGILSADARLLGDEFDWKVKVKITYLKFFSHSLNPFSAAATLLAGPTRRMV